MPSRSLILALLLSAIATVVHGQDKRPATVVITAPLQFAATQQQITAVGTSEARRSVILFPTVADRVTQVSFRSGDKVTKGDILFQLDDRKEQAQALQTKIQLENAQRALTRLQESIKNGATTQSALDDAKTQVALAEVAFVQAQNDIEDHRVVAPFSGIVGISDIEVGDWVTNQTQLVSLDDRSTLYIDFKAPELALELLKNSTQVQVSPWQENQNQLQATISQIDSRVNANARTIRIRAELNNEQDIYLPGMSFKVVLSNLGQRYAAIPEAALMWGPIGPYIWVEKQGVAKRVNVQVIQRQNNQVLVDGDIQHQQMLVVEGVQRLREGQEVSPQLAKVN
ncbi:Multidrug resistance protein MdtA [Pseudoalteromonas sp. CIP111854]|uniref:Multidrug resistance protein MdtA n=1 Tax=Pseudoalteromonas holothuriae TaxID=2963714 RepID=A0A9W4QXY9_9GAMM|nr:efflux RND transporter periplasmic adaptor subunit [Pseudoalteromonas sp. CIP111854]CAH9058142.1 Multidrug resistance protein MdtA [Pseudoalteromonas sp. CIP111854]